MQDYFTHLCPDVLVDFLDIIHDDERFVGLRFAVEQKRDVTALPLHVVEVDQRRVHPAHTET